MGLEEHIGDEKNTSGTISELRRVQYLAYTENMEADRRKIKGLYCELLLDLSRWSILKVGQYLWYPLQLLCKDICNAKVALFSCYRDRIPPYSEVKNQIS